MKHVEINFPTASESHDLAVGIKSEIANKALNEVKGAIDRAIGSGNTRVSYDVRRWDTSVRNIVVSFLKSKGYWDVEVYYGDQRDPCCELKFNFSNG